MGGLTFRPELAAKVMDGTKTVTRRLVSDNPRSPWWQEKCALKPGCTYAVQPGRGVKAVGRAEVVSIRKELLGAVDEADARREGFDDMASFIGAFAAINGWYNPVAEVWRIELKAVQ